MGFPDFESCQTSKVSVSDRKQKSSYIRVWGRSWTKSSY